MKPPKPPSTMYWGQYGGKQFGVTGEEAGVLARHANEGVENAYRFFESCDEQGFLSAKGKEHMEVLKSASNKLRKSKGIPAMLSPAGELRLKKTILKMGYRPEALPVARWQQLLHWKATPEDIKGVLLIRNT